ncbi:hypothetical protein DL96DRAFT_1496219 [Flagelloscypha sp. PMI_526]|nr:hypothetical protein DL96DRAFT_1496219 [Flagelloscypha sp. PMI_526]
MSTSIELTPQAGMRLMSACVMAYDWIVTLPSEYRLYRRQKSILRPSVACILFFAARYLGVAYVISTSVLFFGRNFTVSSCTAVLPLGGFLRGAVATASALIFLWRTWAIWQKNRNILIIMSIALIPQIIFSYSSAFAQAPVVKNGGCTGVTGSEHVFALKWPFALVNLLYDSLACVLGTWKLVMNIRSGVSRVSAILLADGLGFFFLMVITHVMNLSFLLSPDPAKQTILVTFQAVLTSILAQRIITSLSERTSAISSSDHGSSARDRSRSHSRSRSIFSKVPRPPANVWGAKSATAQSVGEVRLTRSRGEVEMMKIQVDVHQMAHVDDLSSLGVKEDKEDQSRSKKKDISFA